MAKARLSRRLSSVIIPNSASAWAAYQQGDVQGIGDVTSDILPDVLKASGLSIYTARQPEMSMILFNLNNSDVAFCRIKMFGEPC